MPTIPTAVDLGVATPRPDSNVPNVGAEAGAVGEAQARAGGEVVNLGNTVLDVHDEIAYANANSMLWQSKVALDQKYKNDPDPKTAPQRYEAELQAISQQAAGMITRPRMQTQFQDMASRFVIARGVEMVQNRADAQLQDQGRAALLTQFNTNLDLAVRSGDDATAAGLIGSMGKSLDAGVSAGYVSATEAVKLKQDFGRDYADAHFNAMGPRERWQAITGQPWQQATPEALTALTGAPPNRQDLAYKTAMIESGGDPGRAGGGAFQFKGGTAREYGYRDGSPMSAQLVAFNALADDNQKTLTAQLGHAPTDAQLYLAHQQGAAGAVALLQNPDKPAIQALLPVYNGDKQLAAQAILANGGNIGMTAGQFASHWQQVYDQTPGQSSEGAPVKQGQQAAANKAVNLENLPDTWEKNGTIRDYLDPSKIPDILRQTAAEIKSEDAVDLNNQANQQAQARADMAGRVNDAVAEITVSGKSSQPIPTRDDMAAIGFSPAQIDRYQNTIQKTQNLFVAKTATAFTPVDQDQQTLENFKPQGTGAAEELPAYQALQQALIEKHKAIFGTGTGDGDPAQYVLSHAPNVAQAFTDAGQDPSKLPAAATLLDSYYDKLGVPQGQRDLLPKAMAQNLVKNVLTLDPAKRADAIMGMASSYGALWPRVLGAMVTDGKLPQGYEMIPALGDPTARTMLANALTDPTATQNAVGKADQKLIEDGLNGDSNTGPNSDLAKLGVSLSFSAAGSAKFAEIKDTVKLLAQGYAAQGMNGGLAVQRAIAAVTTDKYDWVGAARVPKGQGSDVEGAMQTTMQALKPADLAPVVNLSTPNVAGVMSADKLHELAVQNARNGQWMTNEQDNGVFLIGGDGRPVVKADGSRMELFFNNLPPPPAVRGPVPGQVGRGHPLPTAP